MIYRVSRLIIYSIFLLKNVFKHLNVTELFTRTPKCNGAIWNMLEVFVAYVLSLCMSVYHFLFSWTILLYMILMSIVWSHIHVYEIGILRHLNVNNMYISLYGWYNNNGKFRLLFSIVEIVALSSEWKISIKQQQQHKRERE